jgi:GT2 family glycosyltransferase
MNLPLVISVVLNSNRREDTLQCLKSLNQNTYQNHRIILLDNASCDGSIEAVRSLLPNVHIIQLQINLGYAGNNNVGIEAAITQGADWVFVLNEDTILAPDCIAQLVSAGEIDPSIGIVGPMVYHYDEPNIIQSAGGKTDKYYRAWHLGWNEADHNQFSQPHPVEWISGCGIMVRRAVIEQVGAIDERFFYYVEEFEWCLRARKSGWKIIHVPQAKLWHKGIQRNYQPKPSVTYYATRNRLLVLLKHHASLMVWIVTWSQLLRTYISWTVKPKWRSMSKHRYAMWLGMVDFLHHRWGGPVQL